MSGSQNQIYLFIYMTFAALRSLYKNPSGEHLKVTKVNVVVCDELGAWLTPQDF